MRLFPATRIGVFLCTNGPGFISNVPVPSTVALNIFELVRGNNRSPLEHTVVADADTPIDEHQLVKGRRTNRVSTALHRSQLKHRIEPEDVLGVYGHPYNGDVFIRQALNNTTLELYISEWAHGQLQPTTESDTVFVVEWETTIMDHFYSYPGAVPNFWIDFGIVDRVLFRVGEWNLYNEFEFVRNATLDTFPSIPWSPNSCGPER